MTTVLRRVPIAKGDIQGRIEHIIEAAQACFLADGIQSTTMQDIARQAAMSPANLYRYFASKEAIVVAWAKRERERSGQVLAELGDADGRVAIMAVTEAMIANLSREQAVLRLELWSETARNPELGSLIETFEAQFHRWFTGLLAPLNTDAADLASLADVVSALMKGILVNRALLQDFNARPALGQLRALLDQVAARKTKSAAVPDRRPRDRRR